MPIFGGLEGQIDEITEAEVKAAINSCRGSDPCEAAWAMAQAWNAQKAYELALYQSATQLAIAGLQVAAADNAADKQFDIANRQMRIAEAEYARYTERFLCNEHELADEVCNQVMYVPDYNTRADRAQRDVIKQFGELRERLERTRRRYCRADFIRDSCMLEKTQAEMVVRVREQAYRYEDTRRDYFDNLRFERKRTVAGLGREIQSGQATSYQGGANLASQALQIRANAIIQGLNQVGNAINTVTESRFNAQRIVPQSGAYHNQSPYSAGFLQNTGTGSQLLNPQSLVGGNQFSTFQANTGATPDGIN